MPTLWRRCCNNTGAIVHPFTCCFLLRFGLPPLFRIASIKRPPSVYGRRSPFVCAVISSPPKRHRCRTALGALTQRLSRRYRRWRQPPSSHIRCTHAVSFPVGSRIDGNRWQACFQKAEHGTMYPQKAKNPSSGAKNVREREKSRGQGIEQGLFYRRYQCW